MTIPSWTYSQLDSFETCPKKFYHLRVAKDFKDPPNEHSIWGERVHKAFEDRINHGTPLGEGMRQWEGIARKVERLPGTKYTEIKLSIDRAFQPAPWGSSWSRGIADLLVINGEKAVVLDYKTGKRKPSEQLALYTAYAFAHHEEVREVTSGFVWLKERKIDKQRFERKDLPDIWQSFLPRVSKLEKAYEREKWPAKPSGLCNGWCPVNTCEFYKEKRK